MQNSYSFLLKNPGLKQYSRIAYLISLLNLLFFAWLAFFSHTITSRLVSKILVIIIAAAFVFGWVYKKRSRGQYYFAGSYLFFAVSCLFISSNYLLAGLQILLAAADVIARQDIYLTVNEEGITQSQWKLKKKYDWNNFANIILKDALLTLDFKNNKIRYCNISEPVSEAEFNAFCRKQLTSGL